MAQQVTFNKGDRNYLAKLNDLGEQATGLAETVSEVEKLRDQSKTFRDEQELIATGDLGPQLQKVDQAVITSQIARDDALAARISAEQAEQATRISAENAENAKAQAIDAKNKAETAKDTVIASEQNVAALEATSATSKDQTIAAKDQAVAAKDQAVAARNDAQTAATDAQTAATDAATDAASQVEASLVNTTQLNAQTAQDASVQATAAKNDAQTAAATATAAKNSATAAKNSAEEARDQAQASQGGASLSEANAASSEANAASSEANARTYRDQALSHKNAAEAAAASVTSPIYHAGDHDPSGNVAPPTPTSGDKNPQYYITTSGSFGGHTYDAGDFTLWNGTSWTKLDNTERVASVNGQIGNVTLDAADVGALHSSGTSVNSLALGGYSWSQYLRPSGWFQDLASLSFSKVYLKGQAHSINHNDGSGNFNIKVGTSSNPDKVQTDPGRGSHWTFTQSTGEWSFQISRDDPGLGNPYSWSVPLKFNDFRVSVNRLLIADAVKLENGINSTLTVTSDHGFVSIGRRDSSYCHFYTDAPAYYFDREIYTAGHQVQHDGRTPWPWRHSPSSLTLSRFQRVALTTQGSRATVPSFITNDYFEVANAATAAIYVRISTGTAQGAAGSVTAGNDIVIEPGESVRLLALNSSLLRIL